MASSFRRGSIQTLALLLLAATTSVCDGSHPQSVGARDAGAVDDNGPETVGYDLEVTSVNGTTGFTHSYSITIDCDGKLSGMGIYLGDESLSGPTTETLSNIVVEGAAVKFQASFDWRSYTWYPSFLLNDDGTLTFQDGFGPDNVVDATGGWSDWAQTGCKP